MVCSIIPRPKYDHLDYYYQKTSKELYMLCQKYHCSKFIDITNLFLNSYGYTRKEMYCDGIHLSKTAVDLVAPHLIGQILRK